jgi:predicted nucleic acid-binding protein
MKRFIDTNVAVDLLLARQPWAADAKALFDLAAERGIELCMSAVSITTIYYVARKGRDALLAITCVDRAMAAFTIVGVDTQSLHAARQLGGKDFEDNVQAVCAAAVNATHIVIRDPRGFTTSPVKAIDPHGALAELRAHLSR